MCEICEDNASEVHCADCDMDLCVKNGCDADIHKPLKMKTHKRTPHASGAPAAAAPVAAAAPAAAASAPVAATPPAGKSVICEVCDDRPAVLHCSECDMDLCVAGKCDDDIHRPAAKKGHKRTPLAGGAAPTAAAAAAAPAAAAKPSVKKDCSICDDADAVLHCAACKMYLCTENGCDGEVHVGKNKAHVRTPL